MTTDRPNLPPADELAEVRATLKTLGERETALRNLMLADPAARTGNKFLAELREVESRRCDLKELRAAYPTQVDEHTYPVKTLRVELRAVDQETGEIVSTRKLAKTGAEQ